MSNSNIDVYALGGCKLMGQPDAARPYYLFVRHDWQSLTDTI